MIPSKLGKYFGGCIFLEPLGAHLNLKPSKLIEEFGAATKHRLVPWCQSFQYDWALGLLEADAPPDKAHRRGAGSRVGSDFRVRV